MPDPTAVPRAIPAARSRGAGSGAATRSSFSACETSLARTRPREATPMHALDRTLQTLEPEAEYGAGEYELSPEIFGAPGSLHAGRPLSEEAETALAAE